MKTFSLPFKPEELLRDPGDNRLWAADLPPVDEWSAAQLGKSLDSLIGRLLKTRGKDIAEENSFSLIFALLQAWPRLDDSLTPRIADLLVDAAKRLQSEIGNLKKTTLKPKDKEIAEDFRTAAKVAVFCLKWSAERVLKQAQETAVAGRRGRGRGRGVAAQQDAAAVEEAKESQKAAERVRSGILQELANLLGKGNMPWLWNGDLAAWQQVAGGISDAGFLVLDNPETMKHRETRHLSLRCIAEPLMQEGHQHSNLLVATVSKLMHGLRSGDNGATFAADALLLAHTTPLPRLFLVELPQHCSAAELSNQGAFQRSLASFLVAVAERLPHVVLANIAILLPLLDVDCYPLRSAIVESIGTLLSSDGKKLPSGALCDSGRQNQDNQVNENQPLDESGEPKDDEVQQIVKDHGIPAAHFSIATSTKSDLLATLMMRSLDKSVWVRYRALQTLQGLASNTRVAALPSNQWSRVLEIATRRMKDSASTTRKASMQLVKTLIEFHPYGPALKGSGDERSKAEKLLKEVTLRFQQLQAEEAAEAEQTMAAMGGDPAAAGEETSQKRKRLTVKTVTDQTVAQEIDKCLAENGEEVDDPDVERNRKREALKKMHDCYSQRLQFVELIDAAEARLRSLLMSRTATDVTEAIAVVVELRLKGVPAATKAFDQVLGLVWSRQPSIKDAAVEAFNRMHLEHRDASEAVRSLLEMYQQGCVGGRWTYTHLASVQELIQLCAEKQFLNPKVAIPELVSALNGPQCPMALRAIAALSGASAPEVAAMLPCIAEFVGPDGSALGGTPSEQLERTRLLCQVLKRLFATLGEKVDGTSWTSLWALCQHSICVVVEAFSRALVPPEWYGAAQEVMDLSFDLAFCSQADMPVQQCPDKMWEQILSRMMAIVLGQDGNKPVPICDDLVAQEGDRESDVEMEQQPVEQTSVDVNSKQYGCVVFISGHLALRMLIYLETLQSALKRKRLSDEDAKIEEQREANKKKTQQKKKKGSKQEEDEPTGTEASMGMAGQEEREAEAFAEMAEFKILYGPRSMLDVAKPLIFSCLNDNTMRNNIVLRRVGAISLCKYMTVSKKFCQENIQLLFSILFPKVSSATGPVLLKEGMDLLDGAARETGMSALFEDLTLRQSLLVAVGDLLFRHPNVVEPWTDRLYAALGSTGGKETAEESELRLTALLVLTHLVLNDMVKPRAVLLVRALWLTACVHEATARVARILYQELSKRTSNIVYNLLPEIIARMPDHQATAGQVVGGAEERVHYVMEFIEKEKHIEGLIEKLSVRLEQAANQSSGKATTEQRKPTLQDEAEDEGAKPENMNSTVRCLSYALSGMNYSDRCILRLHDAVVTRKALNTAISYFDVTRECLLNIVEKCRKAKSGSAKGGGEEMPEPAAAPVPVDGGGGGGRGGCSAAAVAALDAIESTVQGLASGKGEGDDQQGQTVPIADSQECAAETAAPVPDPAPAAKSAAKPAKGGGRGKIAKRKNEDDDYNPGFDSDAEPPTKKGRGRGRGRGEKSTRKKGA